MQPENIEYIFIKDKVLKLFKFIDIKEVHSENILLISLTKEVLKLLKSNIFNELYKT